MIFLKAENIISYSLRNGDFAAFQSRPILFLHSALSDYHEFDTLSSFYPDRLHVLLDFPAHGKSTTESTELTIGIIAEVVRDLLIELKIFSIDIIGYSMGGYVALELALIAPSLVNSIVAHAMKFYWTEKAIDDSINQLTSEAIKSRSMKGFEKLSSMHSSTSLEKTLRITRGIINNFRSFQFTENDLLQIQSPLLISVGDRDELISLPEIVRLFISQDKTKTYLAIHPNSPHPISKLDLSSFSHCIREFWKCV